MAKKKTRTTTTIIIELGNVIGELPILLQLKINPLLEELRLSIIKDKDEHIKLIDDYIDLSKTTRYWKS